MSAAVAPTPTLPPPLHPPLPAQELLLLLRAGGLVEGNNPRVYV